RHDAAQVQSLAQKKIVAQVERAAKTSAGTPADHRRLDLGQVAFLEVGKTLEKLLASHQAQDGVAQELKAFVGVAARIGAGGVRQGGAQQFRLSKLVADRFLAILQNL